jgi:ankyrin repeat protein
VVSPLTTFFVTRHFLNFIDPTTVATTSVSRPGVNLPEKGRRTMNALLDRKTEVTPVESLTSFDSAANSELRLDLGSVVEIFTATSLGYISRVEELLQSQSNLIQARLGGSTPVFKAVQSGHTPVVELLLSYGADLNARTPWGASPLHWVAQRGHTSMAEFLLDRGADVAAKDAWKKTPRERALEAGHRDLARLLRNRSGGPSRLGGRIH